MILNSKNLDISGVKLFDLKFYKDQRGSFSEVFLTKSVYEEFNINYVQENESISKKNVFRGMHFQKGKYSQSKMIRVVKGKVIDVICDLRKSSETFKKIIQLELNPNKLLFIPKGLAHGFFSLEDGTILNYKCDEFFNSKYESGFNLLESNLNIDLDIKKEDILVSKKDRDLPVIDKSYIYEDL
tara:strand:- start:3796 stop:4347 length:552 start_codon:yes stop_codon:yes gene_type:complete